MILNSAAIRRKRKSQGRRVRKEDEGGKGQDQDQDQKGIKRNEGPRGSLESCSKKTED